MVLVALTQDGLRI